ncbi:MAG: G5 domain-containing protein [Chloroflexota bacterium]
MNTFSKRTTAVLIIILLVIGAASLGSAVFLAANGEETAVPPTPTRDSPALAAATATVFATRLDVQQITVQIGNHVQVYGTTQTTLGDFLAEAGIPVGVADQIEVNGRLIPRVELYDTPLPAEVSLQPPPTVTAPMPTATAETAVYTILVDGAAQTIQSSLTNPLEIVAEAGIALNELDTTRPGPETAVSPGSAIEVIRVSEQIILEDEVIPYETLWQPNDQMDLDTREQVSMGTPGLARKQITIRLENGVEVSRTQTASWIEQEAVNEVTAYGTRINLGVVQTEQGPREYWRVVKMRVTSYTAASSGKAPTHPGYGITASGLPAGKGVVAIDPNVVPFQSEVFVPGYGVAIAGDTGGGIRGRWLDLGWDEDNYESWTGHVDVYYLTPVPPPEKINYLLPSVVP